jgi:hypothetical protein
MKSYLKYAAVLKPNIARMISDSNSDGIGKPVDPWKKCIESLLRKMKIHYGGHKSPVIGHEADESYPNPKN